MLFKAWFYICKLAILGFILVFLGVVNFIPGSHLLLQIGTWIVVPIGLASAILAIPLHLFGWRTACPFCGQASQWATYDKAMALDCNRCGLIHGNPVTDWKLQILKEPENNEDDSSTEELDAVSTPRTSPKISFKVVLIIGIFGFFAVFMLGHILRLKLLVGLCWICVGLLLACMIYGQYRSGVSQSNWGTFTRNKQPIRFYLDVIVSILFLSSLLTVESL
jgi:hypothetical protein